MGEISDFFRVSMIITIVTIVLMSLRDFIPEIFFPGLSLFILIIILTVIIDLRTGSNSSVKDHTATVIGVFVGGFCLIFLGFSISHILEIPVMLSIPNIEAISTIINIPLLSDFYVIEGIIVGFISSKVKLLVEALA